MVYHEEVVLESCLWRGYVPAGKAYALCSLFAPRAIWRLQLKARARSRSYALLSTHYTLHTTHYTLHYSTRRITQACVFTPHQNQMNTTEMKMLRWIQGKTRKDHMRNVTIREKAHIKPVNTFLMKKRLSWFGHVQRRDEDNMAKSVLNTRIDGSCPS